MPRAQETGATEHICVQHAWMSKGPATNRKRRSWVCACSDPPADRRGLEVGHSWSVPLPHIFSGVTDAWPAVLWLPLRPLCRAPCLQLVVLLAACLLPMLLWCILCRPIRPAWFFPVRSQPVPSFPFRCGGGRMMHMVSSHRHAVERLEAVATPASGGSARRRRERPPCLLQHQGNGEPQVQWASHHHRVRQGTTAGTKKKRRKK